MEVRGWLGKRGGPGEEGEVRGRDLNRVLQGPQEVAFLSKGHDNANKGRLTLTCDSNCGAEWQQQKLFQKMPLSTCTRPSAPRVPISPEKEAEAQSGSDLPPMFRGSQFQARWS